MDGIDAGQRLIVRRCIFVNDLRRVYFRTYFYYPITVMLEGIVETYSGRSHRDDSLDHGWWVSLLLNIIFDTLRQISSVIVLEARVRSKLRKYACTYILW